MAKIPYGFDAHLPDLNDEDLRSLSTEEGAWLRLADIQRCLEDREVLPPGLATWLGLAIRDSKKDPNSLLQLLGLKLRQGERKSYSRAFKAYWQSRLWQDGTYKTRLNTEESISEIMKEMELQGAEIPSRTVLQDWHKESMTGDTRER